MAADQDGQKEAKRPHQEKSLFVHQRGKHHCHGHCLVSMPKYQIPLDNNILVSLLLPSLCACLLTKKSGSEKHTLYTR